MTFEWQQVYHNHDDVWDRDDIVELCEEAQEKARMGFGDLAAGNLDKVIEWLKDLEGVR